MNSEKANVKKSSEFAFYKCRLGQPPWEPASVVALATSPDGSQTAAARSDCSLEIWRVSPGSIGWHCHLTIQGELNSPVSSLVWCRSGGASRLLSSSLDGSVSEWDLLSLTRKTVLDSIGGGIPIWQIAAEPPTDYHCMQTNSYYENGSHATHPTNTSDMDDSSTSSDDEDDDSSNIVDAKSTRLAIACDDGCVRIYLLSHEDDNLTYYKTFPRVTGRTLSVAWSPDATRIYSGSSNGFIRCWDAKSAHEIYRISVGLGGVGSENDLSIWSLLALRGGAIVSGDSSGSVHFWDGRFGTLLQAHSYHKGDVKALATSPSHNLVFSGGSDGQVVLYKLFGDFSGSTSNDVNHPSEAIQKWVYVSCKNAHTHDVRAMTVAIPISHEAYLLPDDKVKRSRGMTKPFSFDYHKWAHLGVAMLISGGDDTKLYAYSTQEFTKYDPHDICPAPQRMPMQLVPKTVFSQTPLLFVQASHSVDIYGVQLKKSVASDTCPGPSDGLADPKLVARIKSKAGKITCSAISSSGTSVSYSDHLKPSLFELKKSKSSKNQWTVNKRNLPPAIPVAHSMIFSSDSTRLILAGCDRLIYVVDVVKSVLVHTFTPSHRDDVDESPPDEPPITKMLTSIDGQWLAAINCFGDLYIFNLETLRQHWFVSSFDGASITAAGFTPRNSNILVVSTSSNQIYVFDVEAKQLGEWSMKHSFSLPRTYLDFPGEVAGLSFQPSSSSVIVYSPRAMCLINFGMPVDIDTAMEDPPDGHDSSVSMPHINGGLKRKLQLEASKCFARKNFGLYHFEHPVLFLSHLSENSVLVLDKPWTEVIKTFDAQPVHKHVYGT